MYLIAEIGTNHNGDGELAIRMAKEALKIANAVKMNLFTAEKLVLPSVPSSDTKHMTQLGRFKSLELEDEVYEKISDICYKEKKDFIIAPFSMDSVEKACQWADALKIASGELTNHSLLAKCRQTKLPTFLSTGMASILEVIEAVEILNPKCIMHCVSLYPTLPKQANLQRITALKRVFPDYEIGYSDHTIGFYAPMIALALGAKYFEKHFNLASNSCVDSAFSITPLGMISLVNEMHHVENLISPSNGEDKCNRGRFRRGPSGLRGDYED